MWTTSSQYTKKILDRMPLVASSSKGSIEPDSILVGKYGMLWEYGAGKYYVMVHSPHIFTKYKHLLRLADSLIRGEEVGAIVDEITALKFLGYLKVPNSRPGQKKLMEKYSEV